MSETPLYIGFWLSAVVFDPFPPYRRPYRRPMPRRVGPPQRGSYEKLGPSGSTAYGDTSLIRNAHLPRTSIGP